MKNKDYIIFESRRNTKRTNKTTPPSYWKGTKQAWWSDIGKQARITSYAKNRNTGRTDHPRVDPITRMKKYRWKMQVESKSGRTYTRYVYRQPKKTSTTNRYNRYNR